MYVSYMHTIFNCAYTCIFLQIYVIIGSAALDLCDSKAEVDLLLSLPSTDVKNTIHIKEKTDLLIEIKNLDIINENEKEKVLTNVQNSLIHIRQVISEYINNLKKSTIEPRKISKLNADSELICKIGIYILIYIYLFICLCIYIHI
jgi:hypothetical protein